MASGASRLRQLLQEPGLLQAPSCFDGLSARLIERAGFKVCFMSGFCTSAAKLGLPDTGYTSYGEMLDTGRDVCSATSIPVIADGDTGYGNAMNVKRTVRGYAKTGFACIMLEDQVMPKRCGHTKGKAVVSRAEAVQRIRAAVDARNEGADILILARTDARSCVGLEEALERVRLFEALGADIVFMEAPESVEEMEAFCKAAPNTPKMINIIEGGKTPLLAPAELERLGFKVAVYSVTLLSSAVRAMNLALGSIKAGRTADTVLPFAELGDIVGFNDYYAEELRYRIDDGAAAVVPAEKRRPSPHDGTASDRQPVDSGAAAPRPTSVDDGAPPVDDGAPPAAAAVRHPIAVPTACQTGGGWSTRGMGSSRPADAALGVVAGKV